MNIYRMFAPILGICISMGCASPQTVARKPPLYSYQEPQGEKIDVTIGIVKATRPSTGEPGYYKPGACGAEFADAFDKTLYEMMLAKGMNTKGPFATRDEMTFPDKKGSDLLVAPELELKIVGTMTSTTHSFSVTYHFDLMVGGALVLTAIEPLSGEKMWFKRVELPLAQRHLEIEAAGGNDGVRSIVNAVNNACDELLIDFYAESMPQVSRYFSGDEMMSLKRQSRELREKKSY